jgi:hypothetical protein
MGHGELYLDINSFTDVWDYISFTGCQNLLYISRNQLDKYFTY